MVVGAWGGSGVGGRAGVLLGEGLRSGAPSRGGVSLGDTRGRGDAGSLHWALPAPVHRSTGSTGAGWGLRGVILCSLVRHIHLTSIYGDEPGWGAGPVSGGAVGGRGLVERQGVLVGTLKGAHRGFVEQGGQGRRHSEEEGNRHGRGAGVSTQVPQGLGRHLGGVRGEGRPRRPKAKSVQPLPELTYVGGERK